MERKKKDIKMYSIQNEGKSVVAERFIRTVKNKIQRHMTSISENVYIDKLDDIMNEYNNPDHRTIKMKPIDVKINTYINFGRDINDKDPKFKVGDHGRIAKCKNIFVQRRFLRLKKLQIQFHGHTLLMILIVKKLLEHFMKKNCKKRIKMNLGQKK